MYICIVLPEVLDCCLVRTKLSPEPMLNYCQSFHWKTMQCNSSLHKRLHFHQNAFKNVLCNISPFLLRSHRVKLTISFHSQVAGGAKVCYCDAIHIGLFMSESMSTWFPTSRYCTGHIVCIVHDTCHLGINNFLTADAIQLALVITCLILYNIQ